MCSLLVCLQATSCLWHLSGPSQIGPLKLPGAARGLEKMMTTCGQQNLREYLLLKSVLNFSFYLDTALKSPPALKSGQSDALWWQRSGSPLTQVMACCLMAPSHYLNQCWLIIREVVWHSHESNFTGNVQDIYPWYEFEYHQFKNTATSPRDQWVNFHAPGRSCCPFYNVSS